MSAVVVSLIFGIVNVPAVGAWAMGQQMRRVLTNPARMRAFTVTMAPLLIASSIPVLAH